MQQLAHEETYAILRSLTLSGILIDNLNFKHECDKIR